MAGMSVEEMEDEVRSMIADRNATERQRYALAMLLRMAARGRHISSRRLPAVTTAMQSFAKVGEILRSSTKDASDELQKGLDAMAASGPEPDEADE